MDLHLLPDDYAICKIDTPPDLPLPRVAPELYCLIVTDQETSIVCPEAFAPKGGAHELGFRAFRIAGKLPFAAVGILAKLSGALAEAEVPLFAVSTYSTDYLLVHHTHLEVARRAFAQAGCRVLLVEEA